MGNADGVDRGMQADLWNSTCRISQNRDAKTTKILVSKC
jgi:hypothetical protein